MLLETFACPPPADQAPGCHLDSAALRDFSGGAIEQMEDDLQVAAQVSMAALTYGVEGHSLGESLVCGRELRIANRGLWMDVDENS
jgi:hypothetical protein